MDRFLTSQPRSVRGRSLYSLTRPFVIRGCCTKAIQSASVNHLENMKKRGKRKLLFVVALVVVVALTSKVSEYVAFSYYSSELSDNSLTLEEKQVMIRDAIASCIPYSGYMRRKLHQEIGNIFIEASKDKLKPLAAYDFAGHIVVTTQMVGWYGKTVYCRYFNGDREEIGPALSAVVFPESTVYCCRQDDVAYMSVTVDEFETSNGTLWLIDRKNNTPKYGLSLCLAPLYGNESKWLLLAELFEHYKIQGVQYFYVYVKDVDEYSHQLLDDYVKTNEAELVPLSMEGESVDESIKRQHVGVNDCLHRSRRHSRYAILVDLDERLQPTGGYTLENFVRRKMSEMPSLAMIRFTSRWVLREHELPQSYEGEKTLKNFLPMLVSRNTSAIPPRRVIQKCVINPKRVLIQSIHQSLAYYPTFHGYDVPFEDGHIRHYRYINGGNWSKSWLDRLSYYGAFESTEYPRQYISLLYSRIKKRLDYVYRNQPVPSSAETRDETSKRELKN